MRTKFSFLFVVVMFTLGFGKNAFAQEQTSSIPVEQATKEERLIRLRAEQLRIEKELKEAKEEAKKRDTPEMKKAREEAKKSDERGKKYEENLVKAGVNGCRSQAETSAVKVADRVTKHRSFYTYQLTVTHNPKPYAVNVMDEGGVAVYNLCAGGTVTLFRNVPGYASSNMQIRFRYYAEPTDPDIRGRAQSPEYRLSVHDARYGVWVKNESWTINIR